MDRVAANRLRWRCRRGLLELDLVLARLSTAELTDEEAQALGALLALPDRDLWDIVCGRSDRYEPRLAPLVARLRSL
ncbi:MAG: succinate dehydrogenase assembly factor 2 [Burkholderiales bacterium]|nr:succinate dehydrogenase assembly factor 2 [Burkholderiales bacterium]